MILHDYGNNSRVQIGGGRGILSIRAKLSPRNLLTVSAPAKRPSFPQRSFWAFVSVPNRPRMRSLSQVTCSSPRERHIASRAPPPPPCPRDPAYFLPARPNASPGKPRPTQRARPANLPPASSWARAWPTAPRVSSCPMGAGARARRGGEKRTTSLRCEKGAGPATSD